MVGYVFLHGAMRARASAARPAERQPDIYTRGLFKPGLRNSNRSRSNSKRLGQRPKRLPRSGPGSIVSSCSMPPRLRAD